MEKFAVAIVIAVLVVSFVAFARKQVKENFVTTAQECSAIGSRLKAMEDPSEE